MHGLGSPLSNLVTFNFTMLTVDLQCTLMGVRGLDLLKCDLTCELTSGLVSFPDPQWLYVPYRGSGNQTTNGRGRFTLVSVTSFFFPSHFPCLPVRWFHSGWPRQTRLTINHPSQLSPLYMLGSHQAPPPTPPTPFPPMMVP